MNINFLLPPPSSKIAGGYKIVYQYANYCCANGMNVNIVYDCGAGKNQYHIPPHLFFQLKRFIAAREPRWFLLNDKIRKIPVYAVDNNSIPDADIVIATACGTAPKVNSLHPSKGKKIYLIQDFENWNRTEQEVYDTYRFQMDKIVISKWLKKIVDTYSLSESIYIPNGIDESQFNVSVPIESRSPYSIAMLYHRDERKRSKEGLEILKRIKSKYPAISVELFGSPNPPEDLPSYINYTRNANESQLREIYNKSAIFMVASEVEGYGLTGLESMFCGCALTSTDCQGVQEYAIDGKNALLSPVAELDILENNLTILLEDNTKRIEIAKQGSKDALTFTLSKAQKHFFNTLKCVK